MTKVAQIVDACGLQCPMPLLKMKQALHNISVGEVVELLATDAGSQKDVAAFAKLSGHDLLVSSEEEGVYRYRLRRTH
ncbi:sulfurtransferase TusA family protein [Marinibactrum halimedae]|nr:sulfurtransferase TusA family protein [Marinibactrum halimedae]MCD9457979.1 sulfurtransferase TusA family protein [Marinibactrum halimedae]